MSTDQTIEVCGFIGLGSQGGAMARRMIDDGLQTVLWARRSQALDPYRDTPALFAATVAGLGAQVDHVGVCVVNDRDVQQVCDELIATMKPGSRIAIHATVLPETCRDVERKAGARGIRVVDAPVSGGGPAAEAGKLTVMVGGSVSDFELARPIFASFGELIVHLGPVGAGQQAKLINNTLFTANLGMAHDALVAAAELGIAEDQFVKLLRASSGRSYGVDVRAGMPPPAKFRHAGELLAKDVRLLGELIGQENAAFQALQRSADEFLSYILEAAEG